MAKRIKKFGILAIVFLVVVGCGIGIYLVNYRQEKKSVLDEKDCYWLKRQEVKSVLIGTGVVGIGESEILISDTKESVKEIYVSEGELVKKGDLICSFNTNNIDKEIEELKKKIKKVDKAKKKGKYKKQQLEIADKYKKQRLNQLELQIKQEKKLLTGNDVTGSVKWKERKKALEKEIKKTQEEILTTQKKINKISKKDYDKEIKGKMKELKEQKKRTNCYAEKDGCIKTVYASAGKVLDNGKVMQYASENSCFIDASMNDYDYEKIHIGMVAEITFPYKEQFMQIEGKIVDKQDMIVDGMCHIKVEIASDSLKEPLLEGKHVAVNVINDSTNSYAVPYDFIEVYGKKTYVWRYSEDRDSFEKIEVNCGLDDGYYIQIESEKLAEGDCVVKQIAS